MTYYEILEVTENASAEVIHMAYKVLAKKYHPDWFKGNASFAEEQMKQINTAYRILSDASSRIQYDAYLRSERREEQKAKTKKTKKEKKPPTFKRSVITVSVLLLLSLALEVFVHIIEGLVIGYALYCAFVEFLVLTFAFLFFPLLIGAIKKECSLTYIELMSWISCALIMAISNAENGSYGNGWLLVIFYAIINKHIVFQMRTKIQQRKHRLISVCVALFLLFFILSGSVLGLAVMQINGEINAGKIENTTKYYIGDVYFETKKPTGNNYYCDIDGITRLINYTAYYMDKNGNLIKIDE